MKNNPRWVKIWLLASAIWGAILTVGTARLILNPPSFEAAATASCPQLMLRPLPELELFLQKIDPRFFFKIMVWRDAKTREELVLYRKGEQVLTCSTLEARAQLLLAGAQTGIIKPQIYLRTKVLTLIIVLSSLLLAPLIYIFHLPFSSRQVTS